MVDVYAVNRRFELFLMQVGHDPNQTPDDRMTFSDMERRVHREPVRMDPSNSELIATVVYDYKNQTVKYVRARSAPESSDQQNS